MSGERNWTDQSSLSKSFGFVTLVHRNGKISNQTSLLVEMVAAYPEKKKSHVSLYFQYTYFMLYCVVTVTISFAVTCLSVPEDVIFIVFHLAT